MENGVGQRTLEAVVTGRVQMVMFRDFTQRRARALGLVGTVENQADGSVRVVATGEKGRLQELVEKLRGGPPMAKVEAVEADWRAPTSQERARESFELIR